MYKVPGGKLLKIFLCYDDTTARINTIQITGDFFAYPEESIEQLEGVLRQKQLEQKEIQATIESFVKKNKVEFIGVDASTLTDAIMKGAVRWRNGVFL